MYLNVFLLKIKPLKIIFKIPQIYAHRNIVPLCHSPGLLVTGLPFCCWSACLHLQQKSKKEFILEGSYCFQFQPEALGSWGLNAGSNVSWKKWGNERDRSGPCPVTRVAVARGHLDACSLSLCDQHKCCVTCLVQRCTGLASLSLLVFFATSHER